MKFPFDSSKLKFLLGIVLVIGFSIVIYVTGKNEVTLEAFNVYQDNSYSFVSEVVDYVETETYMTKIPKGESRIAVVGKDEIYYRNSLGKKVVIQEAISQVVEVGTGVVGDYVGKLTGYGPDCFGCSTVGNVSCKTESNQKHSLVNDGIYYYDDEYGSVRIVAAARKGFPCGTIIEINNGTLEPFLGVVLDQGGSLIEAWNRGVVWVDLAFESQEAAREGKVTSNNAEFHVKRWGW